MSDTEPNLGNGNEVSDVVVRGSAAGFAQEILAGSHRLSADESQAVGGTDTGPSPGFLRTNSGVLPSQHRKESFLPGQRFLAGEWIP
jgi:hypothetical protein